ncbi:MAG: protein GumC [Deltaproteobacteria bacterium]|nr:protein GumC [Deltaproteobacteria bacterium]
MSIAVGAILNLKLPKVYRTSTLILVQRPKVTSEYVRNIISSDLEDRIRTITQQITSWTNLEKIIKNFNLYADAQGNMFMEDKIQDLRRRISVNVSKASRQEANSFEIVFTGKEPGQIAKIANALASYFIDENLKLREDQVVSTSEFLTDELATIRKRLMEKEEGLKLYRKQYMGGLPEQLETNLRILERIQQQIINNQENLREAKNRKILTQQQIAEARELKKRLVESMKTEKAEKTETSPLDQLRSELSSLQARYTEKHPNVIRLKEKIAELEAREMEIKPEEKVKSKDVQEIINTTETEKKLLEQLRELDVQISGFENEAAQLRAQMKKYQERVEETPKREQELMSLKRDYENIRETYNSLLARKLEAELAVNMEKKQKGEQFRVLDPAKTPERPFKPDIRRIFLMSIGLGLAVGLGFAYFRESLDTSFRGPNEIENVLQIPVLANIPFTYNAAELRRKKRKKVASIITLIVAIAILGALIVISIKGIEPTIRFVTKIWARFL